MRDEPEVTTVAALLAWLRRRSSGRRKEQLILGLVDRVNEEVVQMDTRISLASEVVNLLDVALEDLARLTTPGSPESDNLARARNVAADYRRIEGECRARLLVSRAQALADLKRGEPSEAPGDMVPEGAKVVRFPRGPR